MEKKKRHRVSKYPVPLFSVQFVVVTLSARSVTLPDFFVTLGPALVTLSHLPP